MKELRFLQPNQIDKETFNDPVKCKAFENQDVTLFVK